MRRRTFISTSVSALAAGCRLPGGSLSGPSSFDLQEATIRTVDQAQRSGLLTSEELVRLYLARIAAYDRVGPALNTVITLNPRALERAAALDSQRRSRGARGPLHGVPVLLKDNIDAVDLATTNGSAILRGAQPPDDAFLVARLHQAGAVILGKASMGEFAGGSYNSVLGQTLNPYHLRRETGGSSSGSAAAIAANFAMLAVGTDTSTSVRGPCAFSGIVGLRPTTGLISRDGIAPKNLTFDTAGPMARTVTDVALLLGVLAAPDAADTLNQQVWSDPSMGDSRRTGNIDYTDALDENGLRGARLGVVRDFFGGDPEIDGLAYAALATMESLGAELVDMSLPQEILELYLGEGGREIRRLADYRFRADWEAYVSTLKGDLPRTVPGIIGRYESEVMASPLPVEEDVMRLLRDSLTTSTDDPAFQNVLNVTLPSATRDKEALFADYEVDALVCPYFSNFAEPIENPVTKVDDPTFVPSERPRPGILAGYSSVGFPSIVVPMGFGSAGLPMAISFTARPYQERRLLRYAYAYEQASGMRRPPNLVPPLEGEALR